MAKGARGRMYDARPTAYKNRIVSRYLKQQCLRKLAEKKQTAK